MTKSVLIIADIGIDADGYYHVGDHAMFINNLRKYGEKQYSIWATTRNVGPPSMQYIQLADLRIPSFGQFIKNVGKLLVLYIFNVNLFPKSFKKTLEIIKKIDRIHISGGGNLNSLWPGHLYYRTFISFLGTIHRKEIYISGQTIGPIKSAWHRIALNIILLWAKEIGIRDTAYSYQYIPSVFKKKTRIFIDDAHSLLPYKKRVTENNGKIKLGLSLHEWIEKGDNKNKLKNIIQRIRLNKKIEFYIIPHVISKNGKDDIDYMMEIVESPKHIIDHDFLYKQSDNVDDWPSIVKKVTSEMDLLLCTRYHAHVFALSTSTISVSIDMDEYYQAKNRGYSSFYELPYAANFNINEINSDLTAQIKSILANLNKLKGEIKIRKNQEFQA